MVTNMDFRTEIKNYIPEALENAKIYVYGMGSDWRYIRRLYRNLAGICLEDQVDYIVDRNAGKNEHLGKAKVITPDKIDISDCVIFIATHFFEQEIGIELEGQGLKPRNHFYDSFYLVSVLYEYLFRRSTAFKNRHNGERCFIIGNGPSLKAEDLEKLHENNVTTIAMNNINRIFEGTVWRPTYYVACDYFVIENIDNAIGTCPCPRFINLKYAQMLDDFSPDNTFFYMENDLVLFLNHIAVPRVSDNLYEINSGGSVIFIAMQLAFYMGFSEIYLLGADNSYIAAKNYNGEVVYEQSLAHNHFVADSSYFSNNSKTGFYSQPFLYQLSAAFRSADEYAKEHGVILRNATRGGKLDMIERISFDEMVL